MVMQMHMYFEKVTSPLVAGIRAPDVLFSVVVVILAIGVVTVLMGELKVWTGVVTTMPAVVTRAAVAVDTVLVVDRTEMYLI